ncbi:ArnT family glycosyltransferase [Mycolicibacterium psychrotolerans]|uniref:ArnT family glycosyltransferase n=1 Tax=Mycolicibacterium psychrotolerans TaxID=216929 RepID=UPI003D66B5AF
MTTVLDAPIQADPDQSASRRPRWPGLLLFTALTALYCAVGTVLVLRYNIFEPDAPNRVANAGFAIYARDPHLSAIGFVWNPLPSMVDIPFVALSHWWPALKYYGIAGVIQSSLFMAGAALMVRGIALDRGLSTGWRWVAVGAVAVHPMIILYGGSGLSEAAEMFCLVWAVRHLMRWCDSERVGDLAWAGIALGCGYLTRYEVVPAAAGATLLVGVVTWHRSRGSDRLQSTVLNLGIIGFPIAVAIIIWAVTGWIINGELFATFSSQYGNSSQVAQRLAHVQRGDPGSGWLVVAARLFGMQPLTGIAVAMAVLVAVFRRQVSTVVPVAVLGATLTFAAVAQHLSMTFGWFRFYLLAIPMVVCIAVACWPPARPGATRSTADKRSTQAAAALLTASVVVAIPVTTPLVVNEDIAYGQLESSFISLVDPVGHPPEKQSARRRLISERQLAAWLDAKKLPDGAVLMDTFLAWGVWLSSDHPKQFVITSDYDFSTALNRPWEMGIRYIVATNPRLNIPDAINRRYPDLWSTGAGIGRLIYSADGATSDEMFRVYEVIGKPVDPVSTPGAPLPASAVEPVKPPR